MIYQQLETRSGKGITLILLFDTIRKNFHIPSGITDSRVSIFVKHIGIRNGFVGKKNIAKVKFQGRKFEVPRKRPMTIRIFSGKAIDNGGF